MCELGPFAAHCLLTLEGGTSELWCVGLSMVPIPHWAELTISESAGGLLSEDPFKGRKLWNKGEWAPVG